MALGLPDSPYYAMGSFGRAFVMPTGSAATICELEVTGYELNVDSDLKTYDNAPFGRWKQGGNVDANGTLKMHFDLLGFPMAENTTGTLPNLRNGAIMGLQLQVDGTTETTNSHRLIAIIDQLKTSSEFAGTLDYECTYKLQSYISSTQSILYPGDTGSVPTPPVL